MGLFVNSAFDSGNVEVQHGRCGCRSDDAFCMVTAPLSVQVVSTRDPTSIQLRIHEDPFCEHDQRAHFQ